MSSQCDWIVLDFEGADQVTSEQFVTCGYIGEVLSFADFFDLGDSTQAEQEPVEEKEELSPFTSWADFVRDAGPFKPLPPAVEDEESALDNIIAGLAKIQGREQSPAPVKDQDEKTSSSSKYERKSRNQSFGHTLRAKSHWAQVGMKCTHVLMPRSVEDDGVLPINTAQGYSLRRGAGCLVPLQGEYQYASPEELAASFGGVVVPIKAHMGKEAALAGYSVTGVDIPDDSGGMKRYVVCQPKQSRYVKHPKCSASAWSPKSGRLVAEMSKHRAWREEIRGSVAAHRAGLVA